MPVVPTVKGQQVQSQGFSASPMQPQQSPNIGDALVSAGTQAVNVFAQAKQQANIAMAQDATLQLNQKMQDRLTNPQNGFLTLQGKNAIGQGQAYTKNFDGDIADIAGQLPDDASREMFMRQAQQQRAQFMTTVGRHEIGQTNAYESGQQDSFLTLQQQQAAANPALFNQAGMNAYQSIINYGKAHGQSDQEIEANWVKWREDAAMQATNTIYNNLYQQTMMPGGKIQVTDNPSVDQLFSAITWNETRNSQFGKDGNTLISPKGAAGVAQVMESTGPEAARLAGLPWDRDKWLNDPRYNAQIGQAYFGAQMKKYDNNPVLAVAAYNAGPGAVDSWINQIGDPRKGQVSNAQFAAAIPVDETRNYVANVTRSAGIIPKDATIGSLMSLPSWNAMNPANKSQMLNRFAGLYDMQASAGRVALQSKMQDDIARLEAGQPITDPVTPKQWATVMPFQASPAERIQLEKTYQNYQQATSLQPVYQTIMQGTPQQGTAAVQAIMPQDSDPNFKYKQDLFNTAQAKLNAVLRAREDDPGTWLQKYSPVVQQAFQDYQSGNASGEYLAARIQADKDRLGIRSKKIIPDAMVDSLISKIDNNQEASVNAIQAVGQSFGKYSDQVMQQVQKSAYPALQVIMATNNPRAANALWQSRSVQTADLRKGLQKADADSADASWTDQTKDFAGTMVLQPGGTAVWNNFNDQGKRLAYINIQRGMSPSDAAKQAYQDILGSSYQLPSWTQVGNKGGGNWRLPVSAGLDISDVADGASHYLDTLTADQIQPLVGDPRLPDSINRDQSLSRIKDNAQWVTNSNETGLTLMMNGLLVNNSSGQPITVPFTDLAKLGAGNRGYINSLSKDLSKGNTYTPGESQRQSDIRNKQFVDELGKPTQANQTNMTEGMRDANANLYR